MIVYWKQASVEEKIPKKFVKKIKIWLTWHYALDNLD